MKPVLVTTAHRGVFYGYIREDQTAEKTLALEKCRCAIYWSGTKGFLGLAAHGPEANSTIGAIAPKVLLHDVTSVSECTPEAAEIWDNWK